MPMQYHKALCAILLIAVQQRTPALEYQPEPDTATTGDSPKACTARTRVQQYISEESRDYHGRMFEDIYITASALSDVLNCSDRTARRRLKYFEEEGIVYWKGEDSKHKHWQLTDEIAVAADENVRTEGQIINAAQIALQAAEEE